MTKGRTISPYSKARYNVIDAARAAISSWNQGESEELTRALVYLERQMVILDTLTSERYVRRLENRGRRRIDAELEDA